jgi:hypothetical protein
MTRFPAPTHYVRASLVAGTVLALASGNGCARDESVDEGAYVNPPGFTAAQTGKVALRPELFVRDGRTVQSSSINLRRSRRAAAGLAADANSPAVDEDFRLEATFPGEYHEGMRVAISSRPTAYVDVVPQKAKRGSVGRLRQDHAILAYAEPYPHVTASFGCTDQKVEEFLSIPSAEFIPELAYELKSGPDFGWWTEGDGKLYAFAKDGKALFALDPPIAEDAVGKVVVGSWKVSVGRSGNSIITADIELKALTFPVLLDPTFETPEWFQGGNGVVPPGRAGATATFRPTDGCVIVFGGATGATVSPFYSNSTFTRCNGTWSATDTTSGATPTSRAYSSMSYAPGTGKVYLFGGYTDLTGVTNDLFELNGSVWSQVPTTGTWPSARFLAGAGHDGTNLVVFGGVDGSGNNLGDTWIWNGSSWSAGPPMAGHYGFATAQVGNSIYAVGGYNGSIVTKIVQRYSGGSWNTNVDPADAPIPTTSAGAISNCIDPSTCDNFVHMQPRYLGWAGATPGGNVVTGGGVFSDGVTDTYLNDAWLIRDASTAPGWLRIPTNLQMAMGPRESGVTAYDTTRNEMLLFGGFSNPTGAMTVSPRLYKGRGDSATLTVTCVEGPDGNGCDTAVDSLTLSATRPRGTSCVDSPVASGSRSGRRVGRRTPRWSAGPSAARSRSLTTARAA